jgi:hypothetical protein
MRAGPSMSMVRASAAAIISGPDAKRTERHAGIIVHAINLANAEAIHQAIVDISCHHPRPLRRLKNHHGRAGKLRVSVR